jgi:hypothetical protein
MDRGRRGGERRRRRRGRRGWAEMSRDSRGGEKTGLGAVWGRWGAADASVQVVVGSRLVEDARGPGRHVAGPVLRLDAHFLSAKYAC